jgi:hypothetical protein
MKQPISSQDRFQAWLAHMDDALDEFLRGLPPEVRERMDRSVASLGVLERWLLTRYPSIDAAKPESEALFIGGAARYVGEVLRCATASKWEIELLDRDKVFFGVPVLSGGRLGPTRESPRSLVTASLARRTGSFLSGVVGAYCR